MTYKKLSYSLGLLYFLIPSEVQAGECRNFALMVAKNKQLQKKIKSVGEALDRDAMTPQKEYELQRKELEKQAAECKTKALRDRTLVKLQALDDEYEKKIAIEELFFSIKKANLIEELVSLKIRLKSIKKRERFISEEDVNEATKLCSKIHGVNHAISYMVYKREKHPMVSKQTCNNNESDPFKKQLRAAMQLSIRCCETEHFFTQYTLENNTVKVNELLERGIDINLISVQGDPMLVLAVKHGHVEMVRLLINNGVDLELTGTDGATALFHALGKGTQELDDFVICRSIFFRNYAHVDKKYANIIMLLVGTSDSPEMIVSKMDDVSKSALLRVAVRNGYTYIVRILFALWVQQNNTAKVKELLAHGIDINLKSPTGEPMLALAIKADHLGMAKLLIDHGVDFDMQNNRGTTALHCAIGKNIPEMVWFLLESGADIDKKDWDDLTLLDTVLRGSDFFIDRALRDSNHTIAKILLSFNHEIDLAGDKDYDSIRSLIRHY